jgi:hypothetical protein
MAYISDYEIQNHYYLGARNTGPTYKFKGNIAILNIFVNDMWSSWPFEQYKNLCKSYIEQSIRYLLNEAAKSGCKLQVKIMDATVTVPTMVTQFNQDWIYHICSQFGQTNFAGLQSYLERTYGVEDAPVMLLLNNNQRSFALAANSRVCRQDEVSVVYQNNMCFDWRAYTHELLHQFGAADYYLRQCTVNAAMRYFPNSIMFQSGNEIDDLTRYLIGWTDHLTDKARAFLAETKSVNAQMIIQAQKADMARASGGGGFGGWGGGWGF